MNDWFIEDEDDIFTGSAKSKFFDIVEGSNNEIVRDELDKIIEKYAVLELLISQNQDEDFDVNKVIDEYIFKNSEDVENMKKGLYIEFAGEIIRRLDS